MPLELRSEVATALERSPIIGVVRTTSATTAGDIAETFLAGGLELVEITFTVPDAPELVERLRRARGEGPPWIGMGTVTNRARAERAVEAGSEFIVSPNTSSSVAAVARDAGRYLVMGALTATEIVRATELGADLVKVYPLPPVGGPDYLEVVRQPLSDIRMLAAGGFGIDEIPAYRRAGAVAYGIGSPLLGRSAEESRQTIARALALARGEEPA
ncbi:MAG: 2-dehydro-3-deoxyphosphogluconate aldolase [Thermoanaerobaculia bacterium]|nr:2-dehydro-3-deoxyphosphogluconate aldolase [Thermoanaerobaculia bacterium]